MSSMVLHKSTHIWISILWSTRQACDWWNGLAIDKTKISLTGFINFLNHDISNISNIYKSESKFELSISNEMWKHVFRSAVGSNIFAFFSYFSVTYLVSIFFFLYVVITHLLWRGEGLGIYCKLIPDWIKSTWAQISFPAPCRARIQNQIQNTTWRSISI